MTVTYMQHVHTASFGSFIRILTQWRGSIFKGIGRNLLLYCLLLAVTQVIYRFGLSGDEELKQAFERLCVVVKEHKDVLPLDFILGFYVTQVVSRWWHQFTSLYWVDTLAMNLAAFLPGDKGAREVRRQLVRLANLSSVMALRRISTAVAKRFPTFQHLVEAGLMTTKELRRVEHLVKVMSSHQARIHGGGWEPQLTWEPILWAQAILRRAREEGKGALDQPLLYVTLHNDLADVARCNHTLISYSWVALPLVYTQLVTMAVYLYFFFSLFSSQSLEPTLYKVEEVSGVYTQVPPGTPNAPNLVNLVGYNENTRDFTVPVFTLLKFIFYFGWLHVAEVLINPFGEDDEDFDANYLIDRNLQASYLQVEGGEAPWQELDDPFEGGLPTELPHTAESFKTTYPPPAFPTDGIRKSLSMQDTSFITDKHGEDISPFLLDGESGVGRRTSLACRAQSIGSRLVAPLTMLLDRENTEVEERKKEEDEDEEEDEEEYEEEGAHDTITSLAGARILEEYKKLGRPASRFRTISS